MAATQNPPFGSPAWRAKYARGGSSPAKPAEAAQAIKAKLEPQGRGRPGRSAGARRQPISELAQAISSLEQAVKIEPEQPDKETLEGCLRTMKAIQGKNESEEKPGG